MRYLRSVLTLQPSSTNLPRTLMDFVFSSLLRILSIVKPRRASAPSMLERWPLCYPLIQVRGDVFLACTVPCPSQAVHTIYEQIQAGDTDNFHSIVGKVKADECQMWTCVLPLHTHSLLAAAAMQLHVNRSCIYALWDRAIWSGMMTLRFRYAPEKG